LHGGFRQTGSQGQHDTFRDDIGAASLPECLDRLRDYLTRNTGDDWVDAKWRRLQLYDNGDGLFEIIVDYARGDSGEEAQ
jgi:hypothetical protein